MLKNPVPTKTLSSWLAAGVLGVTVVTANAVPVIYTDEATYTDALTAGGYATLQENFENDSVWARSRFPASTAQVNSQGILWTSNFATNAVSTSRSGFAGSFGLLSSPHGDPDVETNAAVCDVTDPIPPQCFLHDGFTGTSEGAGTLYAVGGWINGTYGADVTLLLDTVEVGFGAGGNISDWTFLGVVDSAGFNSFEFRETNGTAGQVISIRADNVTLGVSAVPLPPAAWLFGSGLMALAGMLRRKS